MRKLAPHLAREGFDVGVFSRHGHVDTVCDEPHVRQIFTIGIDRKPLSTLSYGLTASLHAAIARPDVVLVLNTANGYYLPVLRLRRIPVAINVDGMEWERQKWNRLGRAVFRLGAKLSARYATRIIADSEAIADYWDNEFGRQSTFIPYGADFDIPAPDSSLLPRGVSPYEYLLVVARLVPENNIDTIIAAYYSMRERPPLVIVGSAGYQSGTEAQIRRIVADDPAVRWLGHVKDQRLLAQLWQQCAVYLHGHSVGGTNPALLQALACGAPTAIFDSVYNREVVGPDYRFSWRTKEDLAEAICHLLQKSTREEAAAVGRRRASESYRWDDVLKRYSEVLLELANGSTEDAR